jgi:LemA protein
MKKSVGLFAILAVAVIVLGWFWNAYNSIVTLDENVNQSWAQVENQLQRRFDLIPNLTETVKGYAKHEQDVFGRLADARSRYAGATNAKDKIAAAGALDSALARLMVIVENYPDLKASEQFTRLQDELAGTENRIAVERMRYNDPVKSYNLTLRRVPYMFYARIFGFDNRPYFEAAKGSEVAPKVKF